MLWGGISVLCSQRMGPVWYRLHRRMDTMGSCVENLDHCVREKILAFRHWDAILCSRLSLFGRSQYNCCTGFEVAVHSAGFGVLPAWHRHSRWLANARLCASMLRDYRKCNQLLCNTLYKEHAQPGEHFLLEWCRLKKQCLRNVLGNFCQKRSEYRSPQFHGQY